MAKKSIWKRITSWLSGDSSSSKSSKSNKSSKKTSSKSSTSYSSSAKQTQKDKQDNINKKKKETTAKLSSISKNVNKNGGDYKQEVLKSKAEQKKSNQQRVLNKIAEKSFKADQANEKLQKISNAKKIETPENLKKTTGIKVENSILQSRKDYTTKGEYDPAKSIRKGNENGSTTGYVAKGLVSAGTYGLSNPVMKRVAREDVSKALSDMDKNATKKQRRAEKTAEIVGTLASFSAANPVGRTVGKKLVGTATEKGLTSGAMRGAEALSKTKAIRNIAEATGKDAVELGAKVANELSKDLGLHLTAENLQSLAIALDKADETDGGKQEKWKTGLKEYIKQQAINTGVNATLDLAPTAIKGIRYAAKDKKGTIKLAGDKLVNATKDGLTLENAPKDVVDSMPTKETKAWKDGDFRIAIRDNEVDMSTTETVSGKVKSIDGKPYGVYKRGNSWIPIDINSGMSITRKEFKTRKAAMDYLESEEVQGLVREFESKNRLTAPENAFLEAIDNTDRVAKIKARREAHKAKYLAGENITLDDVIDNIKEGSVDFYEGQYVKAVGEHYGFKDLQYDKKKKLFYDADTKKELFVDQFLRKARLYDKAEAEKLAKETATELPKLDADGLPKRNIDEIFKLPKGKANTSGVKMNASVRLAEKRWDEGIKHFRETGKADKIPLSKPWRDAFEEEGVSETQISYLWKMRDEFLQATQEATGKKDLAFGAHPREEAYERAIERLSDDKKVNLSFIGDEITDADVVRSTDLNGKTAADILEKGTVREATIWDGLDTTRIEKDGDLYKFSRPGSHVENLSKEEAIKRMDSLYKKQTKALERETLFFKNKKVSPLNELEKARISEIESAKADINAKYSQMAKEYKESGYRTPKNYDEMASMYGNALSNLEREKNAILNFEVGTENVYGIDTSKYATPKLDADGLPKVEDFGYHAGDLGKAESIGEQTGGRGTGHFGTGTYFGGSEDVVKGYNSRGGVEAPKHKVDFSKYNLYKAKSYEDGLELHEALKQINETNVISNRTRLPDRADDVYEIFEKAKNGDDASAELLAKIINENAPHEEIEITNKYPDWFDHNKWVKDNGLERDSIESQLNKEGFAEDSLDDSLEGLFYRSKRTPRQKRYDEIYEERLAKAPETPQRIVEKIRGRDVTAEDIKNDVNGKIEDFLYKNFDDISYKNKKFDDAISDISKKTGKSKSDINDILSKVEVEYELEKSAPNYNAYASDSMSTRLMKALGYDGVDVRGIDGLDNTMYGSVIYDVKPETIATPKLDDIGVPVKETEMPTPKAEVKAEAPTPKVELDETGLPKKGVLADDIPLEETPKVELDEIGVPKQEATLNEVAKNNAVDEKMLAEEIDPNQKVKVGKGVIENQKRLGGVENIEPTTVGKQAEAQARYEENYGHGALGIEGTATSRSAKTLEGMQTGRVEGQIMENLEKCGALDYEIVPHKEMENVVMEVAKNPSHYADKMNKIANGVSIETTFKGFSETSFRRTHAEGLATMQYYAQVLKDLKETGRLIPKDIKNKYADCVIAVKDMTSQAGGVLNMQRYYAALSPEQRIRVAKRDIIRLLEQNKGFRNAYKDRLSTKVGEEGIAERAGQIEEILKENKTLTDLLDKLRGADADTSAEIERLTKKLDDLEYERINARDKISELTRQLDEAKASNTAEVENLTRQLDEANNELNGIDREYRAVEDDIAIADTSGNAMTEEELSEGYTACINEVNKMMPMTALDYIQEWRYLAMLGNPKTHFRNSIGNFVFRNVRAVSNAIGSIAERGMKKQFLDQTDKTLSALKRGELDDASISFIENQYGLKKIKNEADLKALRVKNAEKDLSDVKIGDFVTNSGSVRGKKYIENRLLERKEALEFKRKGGLSMTARSESNGEAKTELGKLGQDAWAKVKNEISPESKMGIQNNAMRPRKTIVGKAVGKVAEFNSNMLELADSRAMERNFREAFYKMSKNNGLGNLAKDSKEYKRLYDRIVEESTNDALEATFREYNALADGLNKITKEMYNADASLGKKAGALVVNAVIPFAKTPANILKQSIRYSPAGLLQSSYNLRKAIKTGDVAAVNTAIDRLASGATGTGILGLGLGLSLLNPDMVTTNAGDDPDAKFEKRQGKQDYSLTVKIGDEKYSFSMDWLTPVSTTFFVGAEIANQIRKQSEDRSVFESIENIGVITSRVIEPMLETSMLSGLNNMFEGVSNSGYGTNKVKPVEKMFKTIVSDYASSLVPTLQGQIARTAYSSDKMVTGETDEEYLVNSMKNKMGLANTNFLTEAQGEKTDSWGNVVNEKKNAGDYLKSAAKNLLSPANIQKVNIGKEEKALIKEYNALRKEGIDQDTAAQIFPKPNYDKEFKFGKKELGKTEVKMTAKQLAIYNKARATGGKEAMEALLDTSLFNKKDNGALTVEQRNKLIASAPKSTEEVIRWLINRPEYKNADAEEKKTALVRVLNSSSGGKAVGNKKSSQRAVWKAQGNDPLDYDIANDLSAKQQKMYQKYKGIISKEDVIEMTKYGNGKKLYQYEDGHIRGYFTKAQMLEYLDTRTDLSTEEKAALFNIFTTGKEYGASSSRSGYGGYRRRSGGSSSSSGVNKHAAKITGLKDGKALVAKSSSKSNSKNITLERVKAKVDLPKPKY